MTRPLRAPYIKHADGSIHQGRTMSPDTAHVERLDGRDLAYFRLTYDVRLQFDEFEVVISTPFTVVGPDGQERTGDPEVKASLVPILELYPDSLTVAQVGGDATLTLRFSSGATVVVPPHPAYEAWEACDRDGYRVVCPPGGGELSVWEALDVP